DERIRIRRALGWHLVGRSARHSATSRTGDVASARDLLLRYVAGDRRRLRPLHHALGRWEDLWLGRRLERRHGHFGPLLDAAEHAGPSAEWRDAHTRVCEHP